ncbi:response regulator [Oscillospiraceae bacterium MB08-C2-2]|nr:response regulator [Oscillospiraceae bacterium MB08-C2-2]
MYKIIVADDEPMTCSVVSQLIFCHFPQAVVPVVAANGRQAVEKAVEYQASVVILDIEMPLLNGIEAGKEIRKALPDCQIIYLTAYAQFEYARQAIVLGATAFILKPIVENELVSAIYQALQKVEANPMAFSQSECFSTPQEEAMSCEHTDRLAATARKYIDEQYAKDLTVKSIAHRLNITPNYFNRIFRQSYHISCMDYIINLRISQSKELLENPVLRIREISALVGYEDANYFAKLFRKKVGVTPTEYRDQLFFVG